MTNRKQKKSASKKFLIQFSLFFRKFPAVPYILKWLVISSLIGILVGSASAGFLVTLDWVTNFREDNL